MEADVIRDAADLLTPDATRFEAELFASTALGIYWASAGIGHRDADAEAVRKLIAAARHRLSAKSGAALAEPVRSRTSVALPATRSFCVRRPAPRSTPGSSTSRMPRDGCEPRCDREDHCPA